MTPRARIEWAAELATIIGTTPGIRIVDEYATCIKTGQTAGGIRYVIDIRTVITAHVKAIEEQHGIARALRFVDWLSGRRVASYTRKHRQRLYEDRDTLIERLKEGHYGG